MKLLSTIAKKIHSSQKNKQNIICGNKQLSVTSFVLDRISRNLLPISVDIQ